jgi:hypothetical protein
MATRSCIGIQLPDESILSVYHHWDGYPEWLGRILKTHYNTKDKVAELIDGGDMSSCWSDSIWGEQLPEGKYAPEYYSSRGDNRPPTLCKDLNEFLTHTDDNYGGEYAYHFVNGEWICHQVGYSVDKHMVKQVEIPTGALAV